MYPDPILSLVVFASLILATYGVIRFFNSSWFIENVRHSKKEQIEDILKQLFHVEYGGRAASLNAMAGALRLSHRKLIKLVEEMTQKALVRLENDTISLTSEGQDYALKIIRVHRLWEKYLAEKTGFQPVDWHQLAEMKEHRLDERKTQSLSDELGHPRFDPHGDPIPTATGEMIEIKWQSLTTLEPGVPAKIVHIEDEPESIYRQILSHKLSIGAQIIVIENSDQSVDLKSEGISHRLSTIVASNVSVSPLSKQEIYEAKAVRLSALNPGEEAKILGIARDCRGSNRRRLLDLGFVPGSRIEAEFENPLKEPKAYSIRNTIVALRNDQADFILIEKEL